MKILILTNHSFMLYQFRRELVAELSKGHEVQISVPFGEHIEDFRGMGCGMIDTPIDRRGLNPMKDFRLLAFYYRLLQQEQPELVVTYSIKPNIYGGMVCRMLHIPYCVNVQGLGTAFQRKGLAQLVTLLYRTALGRARRVFFENTGNARLFLDRGIVKEENIKVLPGAGVNLEYYACQPYRETGCVRFLYLGRIMREKGVEEFFWAARHLKERHGSRVAFDVVGFFEDAYRETVEQLQEEGIICFHGFQAEPRPFYENACCVVLPSYHEGMSNVLLEAAATGRAVITSDIPGCREAVEDGVSGSLCPVGNREELLARMDAFVELSPQERARMGLAGRRRMEQAFDKRMVVGQTVAELE